MATAMAPLPVDVRRNRDRIDVRLRPDQKKSIEQAAEIKGVSVTDFIVQNAMEIARRTIREHELWTLERPDSDLFYEALQNPPMPNAYLLSSARRYREQHLRSE